MVRCLTFDDLVMGSILSSALVFYYKIAVKTGKDNRQILLGEGLGFVWSVIYLFSRVHATL